MEDLIRELLPTILKDYTIDIRVSNIQDAIQEAFKNQFRK